MFYVRYRFQIYLRKKEIYSIPENLAFNILVQIAHLL